MGVPRGNLSAFGDSGVQQELDRLQVGSPRGAESSVVGDVAAIGATNSVDALTRLHLKLDLWIVV